MDYSKNGLGLSTVEVVMIIGVLLVFFATMVLGKITSYLLKSNERMERKLDAHRGKLFRIWNRIRALETQLEGPEE
jgi:hypothetical protein